MEVKAVRGHLCEGLKKYQEFSTYGCIPNFSEEGFTRGCDDTNLTPILYCPFCGEKLSPVILYKIKCNECDYTNESYRKDDTEYCDDCYSNDIIVEEVEL